LIVPERFPGAACEYSAAAADSGAAPADEKDPAALTFGAPSERMMWLEKSCGFGFF
jgi:hypothetical protein